MVQSLIMARREYKYKLIRTGSMSGYYSLGNVLKSAASGEIIFLKEVKRSGTDLYFYHVGDSSCFIDVHNGEISLASRLEGNIDKSIQLIVDTLYITKPEMRLEYKEVKN
ncbi:hypothetical protein HY212_06215 [Candidatus Pacearchaeota archaeon]|nr:hypothetical protein [Candidatus Pacearchaeota archaeon]